MAQTRKLVDPCSPSPVTPSSGPPRSCRGGWESGTEWTPPPPHPPQFLSVYFFLCCCFCLAKLLFGGYVLIDTTRVIAG